MASACEGELRDLRIVLLGVSGAGKSSTGNAVLGREVFKESRTRESEIQRGRVEDRNIFIIDTPGLFNTDLTDEEMKKQMMKSMYLSHPGPHVFLLVINLETFREEQRNIVEEIQEIFGEEALKFTMVPFIGREKLTRKEWTQIIHSGKTQETLKYFEGRFNMLNSKSECDANQTTKLLKSIYEMVEKNEGHHYSFQKNYILKKEQERMKEERVTKEQEIEKDASMNIKTKAMDEIINEDNEQKQENTSLRIVILGRTGSGKSSAGNTILGKDAFRVSFLSSTQTCEKQESAVSGKISIIDTPGLLDSSCYKHLQDELKRDIEECLDTSAPSPHVFLLVVRPNGRYTDEERSTVRWIQENFGEDAVHHTIVLFTHVDLLKDESLDLYIRKIPDLQALIDSCGGRFHSFNNQDRKNQYQVTTLLEKIKQMIKDNGEEGSLRQDRRKSQKKLREQSEKQYRSPSSDSTSPQQKQEPRTGTNPDEGSREKTNEGGNEIHQEATETERSLHELREETDQLFRLVMGLQMSKKDSDW